MKKIMAILLSTLMAASIAACGGKTETKPTEKPTEAELPDDPYKVASPMKAPDYTFDHTPTTDELRQTVVKAMEDILSVQWYTPEKAEYRKDGAASDKLYVYNSGYHFAGIPYTEAQRSLFSALEYFDGNGRLKVDKVREEAGLQNLGQAINMTIGNTCGGATSWALYSCCNSISGPCSAYYQTYVYGYLPVGDYKYDLTVDCLTNYPTNRIVVENGRDVMYDSYSKTLPGDLMLIELDTPGKDHSVMVTENNVVKKADGSIDPDASTITIQDQHVGLFEDVDVNGGKLYYTGHTGVNAVRHSYAEWFDIAYIPVTTAELTGAKPYEPGEIQVDREITCFEDLKKAHITSNYPQAVVKVYAIQDGVEKELLMKSYARRDISDKTAYNTATSPFYSAVNKANVPEGTPVEIRVTLSTGQIFKVETTR